MTDKPVIAHLRSRFGTQTRLAEAAGVRPHTISGKRDSVNPLTYDQMRRILLTAPGMGVAVQPSDFFPDVVDADRELG